MAMLFLCDVCQSTLDRREVFEVELAQGTVLLGDNMESRFVSARQPDEYLLCVPCSQYFSQCVEALRAGAPRADAP